MDTSAREQWLASWVKGTERVYALPSDSLRFVTAYNFPCRRSYVLVNGRLSDAVVASLNKALNALPDVEVYFVPDGRMDLAEVLLRTCHPRILLSWDCNGEYCKTLVLDEER